MVTTIIAIYGALVATTSTLLGAWYFLYSGPRLQSEATVFPPADEDGNLLTDEWFIVLRVWNTGRTEITVDIKSIVINHDNKVTGLLIGGESWEGPDVPVRIQGHSGESWWIENFDPRYIIGEPFASAKLSVAIEVAGKREIEVHVSDGWDQRHRRPLILKPRSS
jgi:hypothetical protein